MSADKRATIGDEIASRARAGQRLDAATIAALAESTDILALGALADDARRSRYGGIATFVRVHALDLSTTTTWTEAPPTAHEVRITGTPASLDAAVDAVLQALPLAGATVLRGFSLDDIFGLDGEEGCRALAAAGLDEVAICHVGPNAAAAVQQARAAGLGVRVVGVEHEPEDRAAWLLAVRALQDAVGDLRAVAPLPRLIDPAVPTTGFSDVRQVALTRLALEHVPSVQVDWRLYGPKLAQVALTVGADDLDGVAAVDDLSHGPRRATLEDLRRNISAAGLTPAERSGRHARLDE
ncbi:MAG: hypothetical protein ABI880_03870 [Acidobacteriota bacterium]